jgi:hypothetical protein
MSSLIPWEIGGLFQFHSVFIAGEIDGYDTVIDDNLTATYQRETLQDRVDGGSFRYFSTNPNYSEFRLTAGFALGRDFVLTGSFANTLMGEETAYGQSYGLSLSYSFDTTMTGGHYNDDLKPQTEAARKAEKAKRLKMGGGEGGFEPEIENYDESLFDTTPGSGKP